VGKVEGRLAGGGHGAKGDLIPHGLLRHVMRLQRTYNQQFSKANKGLRLRQPNINKQVKADTGHKNGHSSAQLKGRSHFGE
jgi:hypothetical protein